jgi:hypothetical protein
MRAGMLGGATLLLIAALGGTASAAPTAPVYQVGNAAGPYKIAGGTKPVQVAHEKLAAGNWAVIVKAEIDGTSTSATKLHPAACVLDLDGTTQRTSVSPSAAGTAGSRQAITLNVAAHLAASVSARLECNAPGSKTGVDTIRQIRFTAIKAVALTVGASGGPPTDYGSQTAQTHLFHARGLTVKMPADSTWYQSVQIVIPAFTDVAMTASATIAGAAGDGQVTCEITTGFDYDQVNLPIHHAGSFGDHVNVGLQVDHFQTDQDWTAQVICGVSSTAVGATVRNVRITVYRAIDLQNQNIASDDTYAQIKSWDSEPVLGGWNDGPVALATSPKPGHVADQILPAGRWVVVAKGWLDHVAAGAETVTCTLGGGTSIDRITVVLGDAASVDHIRPVFLMWSGRLSAASAVILACATPTGSVNAWFVKLNAYKAGTLKSVSIAG